MSEAKDLVVVEQPPAEEPPPQQLPPRAAPRRPEPGFFERSMLFVELQPWTTALIIFFALVALHVVILNFAGTASGLSIDGTFLLFAGTNAIEIVLLAFIAYNIILPTLLSHACIRAYDALRPSLMLDDRGYGVNRAGIVDPFTAVRLGLGIGAAVILTPLFGKALSAGMPPEGVANALLTLWMYTRIALMFGLVSANCGYIVGLHQRFRAVTGEHLRVDLFDLGRLQPVVRYGREASFYLLVLVALLGPAIVQPEALSEAAVVFVILMTLAGAAVIGALGGTRKSIRSAKKVAVSELAAYSRELWRRAYAGQRIVEAVAIPALGAMITTRNEIQRLDDWPGGWSVFARFLALALIPLVTWFGGEILTALADALGR